MGKENFELPAEAQALLDEAVKSHIEKSVGTYLPDAFTKAADKFRDMVEAGEQSGATPAKMLGLWQEEEERNVRNIGRSTSIYRSQADYKRAVANAKFLGEYLTALHDKSVDAIETVRKAHPDQFPETVRANFNESSSGQGVEIVPANWSSEIIQTAEQYGYVPSIARNYPMTAKTEYLNRGGSTTAAMVGEEAAPTPIDSTSFFAQTAMVAKTGAAAFLVTRELLRDAKPAFIRFMTEELGRAMAQLRDEQFFKGSGTGANHTGIINTSGTNTAYQGGASNSGKTTRALVSWVDLKRLLFSVNMASTANGIFIFPQSTFGYLATEIDGDNRPIWNLQQPPAIGNALGVIGPNTFITPMGKRCIVVPDSCFPTDAVTTASALFGDFSKHAYWGEREGLGIEIFKESYNGTALSGVRRSALEITQAFGQAFPAPGVFGVLKTSTT
ncbi:MAG: phage major capsid protein [Chlorobi bacterium]|nr:phage major capsid protein [Chlorobiota bacterium]